MKAQYETSHKILAAAERLFAVQGFGQTTLRQITKAAHVNLAAVNYHFSNKECLYREVLVRHLQPLNAARLAKLQTAQTEAGGEPVALPLLLRIFFEPFFELGQDSTGGGHHLIRIIARSLVEPLPFLDDLLHEIYHPVTARFAHAFRRHVPGIPPKDFLWRISFIVGAMHHTLATVDRMDKLTLGICRNNEHAEAMSRLVDCSAAILKAPHGAPG